MRYKQDKITLFIPLELKRKNGRPRIVASTTEPHKKAIRKLVHLISIMAVVHHENANQDGDGHHIFRKDREPDNRDQE